eukprot:TRINITY_DN745_c0_g1_i1.p1 TRINITY_DN745_c0_g1~~TRINITY_DN745_c0_g1_i1.p1  ORF type:complete len:109 (-),score=48.93 TRINITY_DN745_c0_g1_i1:59-385(-)
MDLLGQKRAEQLYQLILILFGVIGWVFGYIKQDFMMTVYTIGAGLFVALLVCVPNWPFYNKMNLKWQTPRPSSSSSSSSSTSSSSDSSPATSDKPIESQPKKNKNKAK